MRESDHYRNGRFHNLLPGPDPLRRKGTWSTAREFFFDNRAVRVPRESPPVEHRDASDFETPPASGLRATWLGHSTVLLEIDGLRVLTDPIWSRRVSPLKGIGPKRFFAPPLPLEALPKLDAVVISHDHYDHLDKSTIKEMHARVPLFVVPLGVGVHLRKWGVAPEKIRELDWWEETEVGALRFACTPARHFSGRGFARNPTLWASWAILGPHHRVYFSGDGGMSPSFAEIGRRHGPFDLTLMEVGAYHPHWADIHSGPEQAVRAHRDLGGKVMVPIHWGTFNLSLHGWTEPAERLLIAAEKAGVRVAIPKPGGQLEPANPPAPERWWPELPFVTAEEMPVVSPGMEEAPREVPVPAG